MNYQPRNNHTVGGRQTRRYASALKIIFGVIIVLILFGMVAPRALSVFFSGDFFTTVAYDEWLYSATSECA